MRIGLKYKNKKLKLDVKECGLFWMFKGLMFTKKENARALLFSFKKPWRMKIHSFFVFFPFVAIWLDDKNEIIELKIIRPFTFFILPRRPFSKLIEIPINSKYDKIVKLLCSSKITRNLKIRNF